MEWNRDLITAALQKQRGYVDDSEYVQIYLPGHARAKKKGNVKRYILVAELAFGGPLPDGTEIHHVDEVKTNDANLNLLICDKAYHRLIHARKRVVDAGGDPDKQKICSACKVPRDFDQFSRGVAAQYLGLHNECRPCHRNEYHRRKLIVGPEVAA